jgi:hypothetical protein
VNELIAMISSELGLRSDTVRQALAIQLSLIRTQGQTGSVDALFDKLPGAAELAAEGTQGGGLLGKMAGGMMGGPLAAATRMQAAGLSPPQSGAVTAALIAYAKKAAGDKLVRQAASNIPGLSGYL